MRKVVAIASPKLIEEKLLFKSDNSNIKWYKPPRLNWQKFQMLLAEQVNGWQVNIEIIVKNAEEPSLY